ncbi:MAG TPA: hypothetical protein VK559_07280 [Ferruginibacter sp.]|nr:hypothetical protein [Ferruginibacter sp.]
MYKAYILHFFLLLIAGNSFGQLAVSGTVYDSTRTIPVKNVLVKSKTGNHTITDSLGRYTIVVTKNDSIGFVYRNKATPEFAVSDIANRNNFDVAIQVRVYGKFKTLKEVTITSKTYKEDSIENREDYADIFNYHRPGVQTSTSAYSGNTGIDLDELIGMFQFRRNKEMHMMQNRLIEEEQDKYVDYKFNKRLIERITTIDSTQVDVFMKRYRPSYEFVQGSSTMDFYQYILDASYEFKGETSKLDSLKLLSGN